MVFYIIYSKKTEIIIWVRKTIFDAYIMVPLLLSRNTLLGIIFYALQRVHYVCI